jgi:Aromatic-ring-opening dioxygenase LigAB, LigA subunit
MNGDGGDLSNFLQKLGEDRELQQQYTSDPEGTLRQAGLSDETIQAVLSRDLERIKGVLEKELPGVAYMCFMVIFESKA